MPLDTRKDIYQHIAGAKDPLTGAAFANAELLGEAIILIVAGSDTSSTGIAGTLFYLGRNVTALGKVTKEVRGAFGDVEEIKVGMALGGCTYLRACIDEALRAVTARWRTSLASRAGWGSNRSRHVHPGRPGMRSRNIRAATLRSTLPLSIYFQTRALARRRRRECEKRFCTVLDRA